MPTTLSLSFFSTRLQPTSSLLGFFRLYWIIYINLYNAVSLYILLSLARSLSPFDFAGGHKELPKDATISDNSRA